MDYRHTEDFARRMEAAALNAREMRRQAANDFWNAVLAGTARAFRALRARVLGSDADRMLPEA